jgi:hypothetical protein
MFVKKIFEEGRAKDPSYQFKDAMKDASARKSEMGSTAKTSKSASAKSASAKSASDDVESEMQMPGKMRFRKSIRRSKRHGKKSHRKSRKMHKRSYKGRRGH